MKYKLGKFKEDLKEGEEYYTVRYQYNNERFRVDLAAKSRTEARNRFITETHGELCQIDDVKPKKQHE